MSPTELPGEAELPGERNVGEPGPNDTGSGAVAPEEGSRAGGSGHRSIVLIEAACTSCMICARECPSWCITIESHTEPVAGQPPGARVRTRNALDRFALDWSLCMFCGICVEECPFDALAWSPDLVPAGVTLLDLTAEQDALSPQGRPGSLAAARQASAARNPQ